MAEFDHNITGRGDTTEAITHTGGRVHGGADG
jgi:hypothetical protein